MVKWKQMGCFERIEKVFTLAMNVSVIVVLFVGLGQLAQNRSLESRRVALDAIGRTRTVEFLGALGRLQQQYCEQNRVSEKQFLEDLNHVVVVYDHIALLYLKNIADKEIIKDAIGISIKKLIEILDGIKDLPQDFRINVDRLTLALAE